MRNGRVIDSNNNPLPFASITWEIAGGYTGITADYNGYLVCLMMLQVISQYLMWAVQLKV